jgi:hypothetical protein
MFAILGRTCFDWDNRPIQKLVWNRNLVNKSFFSHRCCCRYCVRICLAQCSGKLWLVWKWLRMNLIICLLLQSVSHGNCIRFSEGQFTYIFAGLLWRRAQLSHTGRVSRVGDNYFCNVRCWLVKAIGIFELFWYGSFTSCMKLLLWNV